MTEFGKLPKGIEIHGNNIRINFMYRTKRYRETLSNVAITKKNLERAANKRAAILHEITMGTFDYVTHFPDSKNAKKLSKHGKSIYVKDLLDQWVYLSREQCSLSTILDYENTIRYHLKAKFGDYYIHDLLKTDVQEWRVELDVSNKRKNNILIPLRGMFDLAVSKKLIDENPLSALKNLPVDKYGGVDPFDIEEIPLLLSCMKGVGRNQFQYAFWSGVRSSELIAVALEDVDFSEKTIHIQRAYVKGQYKEPKTEAGKRIIELLDPAMEALVKQKQMIAGRQAKEIILHTRSGKKIKQTLHFLFYNESTGKLWENSTQYVDKIWKPAIKKSGLRYRYSYQTRHTYASQMLSMGANPAWIATQMGHEDWGMIRKTYGKWVPGKTSQATYINTLLKKDLPTTSKASYQAGNAYVNQAHIIDSSLMMPQVVSQQAGLKSSMQWISSGQTYQTAYTNSKLSSNNSDTTALAA